jgi:hypothetical protein
MGSGMDEKAIRAALDACLLTDEEWKLGAEKWKEFEDPLDEWDVMYDDDDEEDEDDLSDLEEDEKDDGAEDEAHHGHSHENGGHGHSHK